MRIVFVAVIAAALPCISPAASFDCTKAIEDVEKLVCNDDYLNRLDAAMARNYEHTIASDIGSGARADVKRAQRAWLRNRNACKDRECLVKAYAARIDEVCNIPVISGIHPVCEVPKEPAKN